MPFAYISTPGLAKKSLQKVINKTVVNLFNAIQCEPLFSLPFILNKKSFFIEKQKSENKQNDKTFAVE